MKVLNVDYFKHSVQLSIPPQYDQDFQLNLCNFTSRGGNDFFCRNLHILVGNICCPWDRDFYVICEFYACYIVAGAHALGPNRILFGLLLQELLGATPQTNP